MKIKRDRETERQKDRGFVLKDFAFYGIDKAFGYK